MLLRLGDAAIDMFETDGPNATIEAIAAKAGVSRRTVLRYADSKEELTYVHPLLWIDVFVDAVDALVESTERDRGDISVEERFVTGGRAISKHIDDDPLPVRRAFGLTLDHPSMAKGASAMQRQWVELLALEAAVGTDPTQRTERFTSRILATATMGMIDAMTREWLISTDRTMTQLFEEGWTQIAPMFDTTR